MSEKPVALTPGQMVRHYLQQMLDNAGDGWQLSQFVICMGLERVTADGSLECTPWVWAPPNQADWMTDGLLQAAADMRCDADIDTD